ncbi:MAG: hypothetical protein ACJ72L_10415 [Marmoricola sp.]
MDVELISQTHHIDADEYDVLELWVGTKLSYLAEIEVVTKHLRELGYASVQWLGGEAGGYQEVPF